MPKPRTQLNTRQAVLRVAAFCAFVLAVLYTADWLINSGLRRIQTAEFGVVNRAMQGRANAEIVISGSSRALTHYDSRIIAQGTGHPTFNIGRNGSQTDMQLAFLQAYLRNNRKPRLVIHNLDLFSFVTSREIYDPAQYLPYLREPSIYAGISRVYRDAWKWRALPLYGYVVEDMRFTWLLGLQALLGRQPAEDRYDGFLPRDTPWTGDFEKFRDANPKGVRFEIEPQGIRDLTAIIETCQRAGVALVFVYSPEYAEMQAIEANRAEIFAKFRELCDRYQVPLWDFSASEICRSRDNFYNSQHLNAKGASLFSADLTRRLAGLRY